MLAIEAPISSVTQDDAAGEIDDSVVTTCNQCHSASYGYINACYTCNSPDHLARHCMKKADNRQTVAGRPSNGATQGGNRYSGGGRGRSRYRGGGAGARGYSRSAQRGGRLVRTPISSGANPNSHRYCKLCNKTGHDLDHCWIMERAKGIIKKTAERKGDDRADIAAIAIGNPTAYEVADYCAGITELMESTSKVMDCNINAAIFNVLQNADAWQMEGSQETLEEEEEEEIDEEEYDDEED
ncbi:unnamed protein product [Meganyctiphanes norvegica]|uniref:CCHC-type domain-containing protein n=1 Tax=Meganyctiphanes norvegica TaxID=48144 RepID=A0AAV2RZL1_MEGNR